MKPLLLQTAAVATVVTLACTGCESLTPGENAGAFGGGAALVARHIAGAAGMSGWQADLVGVGAGAVTAGIVYVVAKRQASERQRRIAEERARVYVGRVAHRPTSTASSGARRKKARYIAVDTVKDERTSPKAKKTVMIYDTQSEEFVGNKVYDVQTTPKVGSQARFDTVSAEYVGAGS